MDSTTYVPGYASTGDATASEPQRMIFRRIVQFVGIALILAGSYYALFVVSAAIHIIRTPGDLGVALEPVAKALNLDKVTVPSGKSEVPIGRSAAGVFLLLWYMVTSTVALKIVAMGGKLVLDASTWQKQ